MITMTTLSLLYDHQQKIEHCTESLITGKDKDNVSIIGKTISNASACETFMGKSNYFDQMLAQFECKDLLLDSIENFLTELSAICMTNVELSNPPIIQTQILCIKESLLNAVNTETQRGYYFSGAAINQKPVGDDGVYQGGPEITFLPDFQARNITAEGLGFEGIITTCNDLATNQLTFQALQDAFAVFQDAQEKIKYAKQLNELSCTALRDQSEKLSSQHASIKDQQKNIEQVDYLGMQQEYEETQASMERKTYLVAKQQASLKERIKVLLSV